MANPRFQRHGCDGNEQYDGDASGSPVRVRFMNRSVFGKFHAQAA